MDTIYAQASARGKAGVAIIRISGPLSWSVTEVLAGSLPPARVAGLRRLRLNGDFLDEALVLCFEAEASFTGERVTELHLHGSIATVSAVLRALSGFDGLRLAEPGEFTRRALENGQLDLTQVEGLSDLIEAETEAQRRQALTVLSGAIGQKVDGWRRNLIRACALIEATIDFADEDVPVDVSPEVLELIERVCGELRHELAGVGAAERVREGYEVAIIGRPNSGKSTLLNRLAGREAAITSDVAGTTRDVIEVRMDIDGLAVTFLDTAGLRETPDRVEAIGVARAIERAERADLRLFLLDDEEVGLISPRAEDLVVQGKADLRSQCGLAVSGLTGAGVGELLAEISERLSRKAAAAGTMTRERHRIAMSRAVEALEMARDEVMLRPEHAEIAAEALRDAARALDTLVGRIDVETLLDEIFSSFCIGK
ncbi:tRNA uridine-5-carboxymethylaminomethyl(34) synthesis GTPase MnmE [Paenirhodobacter enshiensis]|uniref:tRNA uridine-5-carboxymethylaminomethyl(34) synthesis GTPase MnmE n=1 Tax=Paenirhodobacter enshiensis TaxID=1105367 RepID=UPI003FA1DD2F